jgi:hypothetical protein
LPAADARGREVDQVVRLGLGGAQPLGPLVLQRPVEPGQEVMEVAPVGNDRGAGEGPLMFEVEEEPIEEVYCKSFMRHRAGRPRNDGGASL